ncbi:uncharacterized protein LOC128958458 [Oppia nitens]|uniref:uncharacterized protein LOC128958458 n=1 Tax=Oppia nitens TaxID=1686743 RepID=UPI0023DBB616|nr:uncharacterized protein LOC128958458 [Oppia nitens]
MSFVLVTAEDVLYGPTCISTEDSALHQQISDISDSTKYLTISSKRRHKSKESAEKYKSDKSDKIKAKYESKLKEMKDKNPEKTDKLREKMEKIVEREKQRIEVIDDKKVKFDPNAKAMVIKVDDAPVRVLNKLAALGYQITPSAGGGSAGSRAGQVWTLFRPGYVPQFYPDLNNLNIKCDY